MNSPDTVVEEKTMQASQPEEPKKWLERPWRRTILLLLLLVIAVVIVVVVLLLTKTIGAAPAPTPAPSLAPEQIACNFIGQTSLTDCRTTLHVDDLNAMILSGSTIPTEIWAPNAVDLFEISLQ